MNLLSPADHATFVESIPDADISTAPVVAPPPRVRLPMLRIKKGEWQGVQCGVMQPRFAVFRHADKWEAFWKKGMAPYSLRLAKVPPVDFEKDMVLGVFSGEKPYPYYEVEIKRMVFDAGSGELEVQYRDIEKMSGVFTPPFAVQPFHLKVVPRDERPLHFNAIKK